MMQGVYTGCGFGGTLMNLRVTTHTDDEWTVKGEIGIAFYTLLYLTCYRLGYARQCNDGIIR